MSGVDMAIGTLQRVLGAEHEAMYAYSFIGARYEELADGAAVARDAYETHRRRRDMLDARLRAVRAEPRGPRAVYDLPVVESSEDALALASGIERRCIARWAQVIPLSTGAIRAMAVEELASTAAGALVWGVAPTAFPGLR